MHTIALSVRLIVWVIILAGLTIPTIAAEHIEPPVDEASQDRGFLEFRNRLLDAIERRDTDAVVAMATKTIQLDFGGGEGREAFRSRLTLSRSDLSEEYAHLADEMREEYWNDLKETLSLGGRFVDAKTFHAPYVWTLELSDEDDPFSTSFIIDQDVQVRDRPNERGRTIGTLSYNKVEVLEYERDMRFVKIKLPGNRNGYVRKDALRSPIDYRAFFIKSNGRWQLDLFLAGD